MDAKLINEELELLYSRCQSMRDILEKMSKKISEAQSSLFKGGQKEVEKKFWLVEGEIPGMRVCKEEIENQINSIRWKFRD